MRKQKIVIINSCSLCPHYNFDDSFHMYKWGKHWCDRLDKDLGNSADHIPEECPLPDKIESEEKK